MEHVHPLPFESMMQYGFNIVLQLPHGNGGDSSTTGSSLGRNGWYRHESGIVHFFSCALVRGSKLKTYFKPVRSSYSSNCCCMGVAMVVTFVNMSGIFFSLFYGDPAKVCDSNLKLQAVWCLVT